MMEEAKALIERLVLWNREKIALLQKILEFTRQQQVAISSNSLNSLLDNIRSKQEIIDEIDSIDRSFYEDFIQLKQLLNVSSIDEINTADYPELFSLRETVNQMMQTLEAIDVLDKSNLTEVQTEIDRVKERMRTVQSQKKVSQGYSVKTGGYGKESQGFYIDGKK